MRYKKSFCARSPDSVQHDWFFSDIICYPERLLNLVTTWMSKGQVKKLMCTIKFQGEADFGVIDQFLAIPNSKIVHLYHNKHELTWWVSE